MKTDTRMLQAREIATKLDSAADDVAAKLDHVFGGNLFDLLTEARDFLAALSTATPPVDGEAKVRETAQALVDKLKAIHEHPAFATVFAVAQERLGPYGGPTYADELDALEGALASTKGGGRPVDREAKIREALEPFAKFADAFDAKPLRMIDDELYGIHVGTEWEASIRLSDCRRAREALASTQAGGGE